METLELQFSKKIQIYNLMWFRNHTALIRLGFHLSQMFSTGQKLFGPIRVHAVVDTEFSQLGAAPQLYAIHLQNSADCQRVLMVLNILWTGFSKSQFFLYSVFRSHPDQEQVVVKRKWMYNINWMIEWIIENPNGNLVNVTSCVSSVYPQWNKLLTDQVL